MCRVVPPNATKDINGYLFTGWGAHTNSYPSAYLTAAAALGMSSDDVDTFLKRLDKCLRKFSKKTKPSPRIEITENENDEREDSLNK